MDVDSVEPGVDFRRALDEQLAGCDYFIAVIGPNWTDAKTTEGRRRLDDPNDYVRLEIEGALRRDIRVVPVLVEGATMPRPEDLPETLRPFAMRNAFAVAHHKFASDVAELANVIMRSLGIGDQKEPRTDLNVSSSWADDLLSFRGRMSRKRFWLWMLALTPITVLFQMMLVLVVGGSIKNTLFFPQDAPFQHTLLTQVGALPFWWFSFALVAKRLHDFNAGLSALVGCIVLTGLFISMYLLHILVGTDHVQREGKWFAYLDGITSGSDIFLVFILIAIGSIPGTPGPNRYGLST